MLNTNLFWETLEAVIQARIRVEHGMPGSLADLRDALVTHFAVLNDAS